MTPHTAVHLHTTRFLPQAVEDVLGQLETDPQGLAERATSAALDAATPILVAGRFRSPAAPDVRARTGRAPELAALVVRWEADEEASGWPPMTLDLVVTPTAEGTRLTVLSEREPGYDLSRNRLDKAERDQTVSVAVSSFLDAIVEVLSPVGAGSR